MHCHLLLADSSTGHITPAETGRPTNAKLALDVLHFGLGVSVVSGFPASIAVTMQVIQDLADGMVNSFYKDCLQKKKPWWTYPWYKRTIFNQITNIGDPHYLKDEHESVVFDQWTYMAPKISAAKYIPFSDVFHRFENLAFYPCYHIEIQALECVEYFGHMRGNAICKDHYDDLAECRFKGLAVS